MDKGHIDYALYLDNIGTLTQEAVNDIENATKNFYLEIGGKRHSVYKLWYLLHNDYDVKIGKCYLFVAEHNEESFYDMNVVIAKMDITKKTDGVDKFYNTLDTRKVKNEKSRKKMYQEAEQEVSMYEMIAGGAGLLIGLAAASNSNNTTAMTILMPIICGAFAWVYFLPSFIAFKRIHPNRWGILFVNLVWVFFINWGLALIWAISYDPNHKKRVDVDGL